MRSVSAAVTTAFASGTAIIATLVKLAFPSGTVALNSTTWPLTWSSQLYQGAAGLGNISPIEDKGGDLPGVKLDLLNVDASYMSLALDSADEVQGSAVTISTAVIDSTSYQIIDVLQDFAGYADTMAITEDGVTGSIGVTAESKGVDLLRGNPLTYNDADQQSLVSGDLYFQYVVSQEGQPVIWPAKEFLQRR